MKTLIKKTKLLLVTFIIILNLTKKSPLFLHISHKIIFHFPIETHLIPK